MSTNAMLVAPADSNVATKRTLTGRFAILEQLRADGLTHIFGNPGTVEQGFLDAMWEYPDLQYVLTLHETVAVMMADGYARASQRPAVVQIHSSPGLGNAIGALYQAYRGHAPLVVLGGDAGAKYQAMDSQMAADLVAMARPVTKWSTMVVDPASTLRVLRRAIKIAATPPMGPVYVCLPQDILDAVTVEPVRPTSIPSTRVVPDDAQLVQAAEILLAAERPMIFIGNGVAWSQAQAELEHLAELLGAEVWEADGGELNMRHDHPLYQGSLGHMFAAQSRPVTMKGDANLIVGTYMTPEVFPSLDDIFADDAKTIHIDLNAYEIAKNHPVTLGMVSDPKLTLARLAAIVAAEQTTTHVAEAATRTTKSAAAKAGKLAGGLEQDVYEKNHDPLHFSEFMAELAKHLPSDVVVFDEALTNSPPLTRYLPPTQPGGFFQTRGGSLGVGIPGAMGAKMALPDNAVWGFTGNECPIARQSIKRLRNIQDEFAEAGARVWLVNSNTADDRNSIRKEAEEFHVGPLPVLIDETQGVAAMLGVSRTATVVCIETTTWTVIYQGAIDDQLVEGAQKPEPTEHYLRDALKQYFAGAPISKASTAARGCLITFSKEPISYATQVAPILEEKCFGCHSAGNIGPIKFANYEKVRGVADMIQEVVLARRMPPWHADRSYGKFTNDNSLTKEEARLLLRWIEQGASRGEGEDSLTKATPPTAEWQLGKPDYIVSLPEVEKVPATGVLDYRHIKVKAPFEEDVWIKGVVVKPDNTRVVHHVIVRVREPGKDGDNPDDAFLIGWAPGLSRNVFSRRHRQVRKERAPSSISRCTTPPPAAKKRTVPASAFTCTRKNR